jgi:hypothetical protein
VLSGGMRRLVLLSLLVALSGPAWALGPQPPCAGAAVPAYGPVDGPPVAAVWDRDDLRRDGWQPPACLGWHGDSRLVAALAGRFHSPLSLDALTERLAAVSHHPEIRFWAVTRHEWRPLVMQSWALERPDANTRRADPSAAELVPGHDLYYAEDAEIGGRAIWRFRVVDRTADRLVATTENLTPIRIAMITIFEPGALQIATVLQRQAGDTWDLYEITRAGANSNSFVSGYGSAYLNRLEAMRRHLAGVPTDRDPPVAPR